MTAYEKKYFGMVAIGLVFLSFLFFQLFYPYHLFFKEQIQLFLFTPDYFFSYFNKPAWLVCYAGDFLTQFFYLRGGGAVVLALIFGFEYILCFIAIRKITVSKTTLLWALFPPAIDWVLHCELLHPVSISLGFIVVLGLFIIYCFISVKWFSFVTALLLSLSGYWLIGNSILILPVLIVLYDYQKRVFSWLKWCVVGSIIVFAPIILRHFYLLTILQSYTYPAFNVKSITLVMSLIAILGAVFVFKPFEIKHSRTFRFALPIAFFVLLFAGIKTNAGFDREKILALDNEFYFGNYTKVIELSKKYNLKSPGATYFTNMALAQKGELPEYLLDFYQPAVYGLIMPVTPDENWQTIFVSNEVFFLYGDMNLAQHSAMLGNTFSPYQRSARMIKRLAEINLINEDTAAANKYLRILSNTLFYKNWAANRLGINHASRSNKWLTEKRAQTAITDTLRQSNNYTASLTFLVGQKPENLAALDYLLCYHLLNKDLKSFKTVYDQYGRRISRPVPSLYTEALLIQLYTSNADPQIVANYALSAKKVKDFGDYNQLFEQKSGESEALKNRFGKSYWFYYHFATIQKK